MNIIVSIKKLSVELMKLEVYYPINKANAQPGQYFNLSTQEDAIPVKAFVDEVKNEKISLIIPHKYQNQLLNISVGDKLYSLNGPYGISFEYKKNESILCLAEGDCVMLYSLINYYPSLLKAITLLSYFALEIQKLFLNHFNIQNAILSWNQKLY
jgi:NAD(P)H-flavin reductase